MLLLLMWVSRWLLPVTGDVFSVCVWRRDESFAVDVFVFVAQRCRAREKLIWILANANFNIFVSSTSTSLVARRWWAQRRSTDVAGVENEWIGCWFRVLALLSSPTGWLSLRLRSTYASMLLDECWWLLSVCSVVNANFLSATNWLLRWK